ncbi:MAG TPA: hypothetical protein VLV28_06260 [Gaiellaceae bacterium]|nr:hypothetical protein [Gaiellaceae bacterium]
MRALRLAAAFLLLAAATILALLASDVLSWRDAMRSGDRQFVRSPADATWSASTVLPSEPSRSLLGLELPLRFRAAEQSFAAVQAAGRGYDNGFSEAKNRGELEAELTGLAQSGDRVIASEADNLLGILAFTDSTQSGPIAPAPVDESVADFQAAVRLDPSNGDAKFNLELLLRQLLAKGVRPGSNPSAGGPARGHRGAGGGIPGRGY